MKRQECLVSDGLMLNGLERTQRGESLISLKYLELTARESSASCQTLKNQGQNKLYRHLHWPWVAWEMDSRPRPRWLRPFCETAPARPDLIERCQILQLEDLRDSVPRFPSPEEELGASYGMAKGCGRRRLTVNRNPTTPCGSSSFAWFPGPASVR